jgi:hypothetical protein
VEADREAGLGAQVAAHPIRNLTTNTVERVPRDAEPSCRRHFTPARWRSFERDVAWFRARYNERSWALLRLDHGYNPSPAWGLMGTPLSNTGPVSGRQILLLAWLDPLLLAAMWGCVAWAFGWRSLCLAAIFWGTSYLSRPEWIHGAFLRHAWLASAVAGLCLLRRGRPAAAGGLLGFASCLRVFPVLIPLAIAAGAARDLARRRRFSSEQRRFAAGFVGSVVVVVALSSAVAGGADAWTDFYRNSVTHVSTPLLNHVGLRTVLSFDPERSLARTNRPHADDPVELWKQGRSETFSERRALFWILVLAFGGVLLVAVDRKPAWLAGVLGIGGIVVAVELTVYYYAILLAFGFLWPRSATIGAGLMLLSASSWWIDWALGRVDETHVGISLACVVFVVVATVAGARLDPGPQD